jgi:hypothetical protein
VEKPGPFDRPGAFTVVFSLLGKKRFALFSFADGFRAARCSRKNRFALFLVRRWLSGSSPHGKRRFAVFLALKRASHEDERGSAPLPRKPFEKGLTENFIRLRRMLRKLSAFL